MGGSAGKTVRFDKLIAESGNPEPATLWVEPEKDPDFMKAVKGRRIVTLCQPNVGAKKDFGLIGFSKEKNATYLVFPKKLKPPEDSKVVGIKYEKLADPKPKGAVFHPRNKAQTKRKSPRVGLVGSPQAKKRASSHGGRSAR